MAKGADGRIDRRLSNMGEDPAPATGFVPSRDPATEAEWTYPLGRFTVHVRQWYLRRRISDFVITVRLERSGEEVRRFDCCHGEAHVHRFWPPAGESRRPLLVIHESADVEKGFDLATSMLTAEVDQARTRWAK